MSKGFKWSIAGIIVSLIILWGIGALYASKHKEQFQQSVTSSNEIDESTLTAFVPASLTNQENIEFIKNYIPQIQTQCPGLIKYKQDWDFDAVNKNGFSIQVSDDPKNKQLVEYRSFRNRCFFDLSDDNASISIPKRACASLCKDTLIDDSSYTISVQPVRGNDDSELLTSKERSSAFTALSMTFISIDNKTAEKRALAAIDKHQKNPNLYLADHLLIQENLDALNVLEKKAHHKDYQVQKNLAYSFATLPTKLGGNAIKACAWYLVVLSSGSEQVQAELDKHHVELYCSADYLNNTQRNEAITTARLIYQQVYNNVRQFDEFYGL